MGPAQRIGATLRQARPIGRASFGARQRLQASGSRSAMPEPTFSMTADDDLPRTIRREREARERQAAASVPVLQGEGEGEFEVRAPAATVVDFDVPLSKLAMFFVRAVFAAIPALLVLMALLWVLGHTLQTFFPQLLKMKILI